MLKSLSLVVALLILRGGWDIASRSWHVLMEGTPESFDVDQLKRELVAGVPGVLDSPRSLGALRPERPLITLHARIAPEADHDATLLRRLQVSLVDRFALTHATVQIERAGCSARADGKDGQRDLWHESPKRDTFA